MDLDLFTDCCDEAGKVTVREERLRKLPEKQLQCSSDNVNVLPLTVFKVQLLCFNITVAQLVKCRQRAQLSV